MFRKFLLFTAQFIVVVQIFSACSDDEPPVRLTKVDVAIDQRIVTSYTTGATKEYLIVLESGLGDAGSIWLQKNIIKEIMPSADVVIYDRAGYKASTPATERDIPHLSADLSAVIEHHLKGRKLILAGHSLGGWIIRDYAIKNPGQVQGLLFIDTAHEHYNDSTTSQETEDIIYNALKAEYGAAHGITQEARQLMEDIAYASTLETLPNIPVVVLTSMKTYAQHPADRQNAYNAQHELSTGISDFTQVKVENAGHYIQSDRPDLVIQYLKALSR